MGTNPGGTLFSPNIIPIIMKTPGKTAQASHPQEREMQHFRNT